MVAYLSCHLANSFLSHADYLNSPEVNVSSEIFGTNDVYIALDVQVDNSFVNISMNSSREIGIAVNMLSAHFTTHVTYNTPTNVSVTAHLCGIHNSTVIALNYGEYSYHSNGFVITKLEFQIFINNSP